MTNSEIASEFGRSLDADNFQATRDLLSEDCQYIIGEEILKGPMDITSSYEQNMIEGREKLDKLEWGECRIEEISESDFFVHFTDSLEHKSIPHTFRCKQKLSINDDGKIYRIEHFEDAEERENLNAFYRKVGLK